MNYSLCMIACVWRYCIEFAIRILSVSSVGKLMEEDD
jgi:hypothetical protein